MIDYKHYQLTLEAKELIKKEFIKNSRLREKKVRLERDLEKIRNKLLKIEAVDNILKDKKFAGLATVQDKQFLSDIEKEVAEELKKTRRSKSAKATAANRVVGKRMSKDEKRIVLARCLVGKANPIKVSSLTPDLEKNDVKTQPSVFLKQCGVPDSALVQVSNAKRDGTNFFWQRVSWLKQKEGKQG